MIIVQKVINFVKYTLSLIFGFFLTPGLYLGFILATNSAKGWNVQNEDGALFIPIGILFVVVSLLIIIACVVGLLDAIKNKNSARYLPVSMTFLGVLGYIIVWILF